MSSLLDAYWRALARIGLRSSRVSLEEHQRVNPLALAATGAAWLDAMVRQIRGDRAESRRVGAAFMRLFRAQETGRTLPPLSGELMQQTTMGALRQDWAAVSGTVPERMSDDDRVVPVDDFEWPEEPIEDHDRAVRASLASTGIAPIADYLSQAERYSEGRGRLDDPDFLTDLQGVVEGASTRAAQAADREVQRGSRFLTEAVSRSDSRVVGYARVTDGDPCHFCSMLSARGAVYTSLSRAAGGGRRAPTGAPDGRNPRHRRPPVAREDLTRYHYGCHCQVIAIYNRNDFLTPEARALSQQWDEVTRGLSGQNAMRAWRHHIDAQRRSS